LTANRLFSCWILFSQPVSMASVRKLPDN